MPESCLQRKRTQAGSLWTTITYSGILSGESPFTQTINLVKSKKQKNKKQISFQDQKNLPLGKKDREEERHKAKTSSTRGGGLFCSLLC